VNVAAVCECVCICPKKDGLEPNTQYHFNSKYLVIGIAPISVIFGQLPRSYDVSTLQTIGRISWKKVNRADNLIISSEKRPISVAKIAAIYKYTHILSSITSNQIHQNHPNSNICPSLQTLLPQTIYATASNFKGSNH